MENYDTPICIIHFDNVETLKTMLKSRIDKIPELLYSLLLEKGKINATFTTYKHIGEYISKYKYICLLLHSIFSSKESYFGKEIYKLIFYNPDELFECIFIEKIGDIAVDFNYKGESNIFGRNSSRDRKMFVKFESMLNRLDEIIR